MACNSKLHDDDDISAGNSSNLSVHDRCLCTPATVVEGEICSPPLTEDNIPSTPSIMLEGFTLAAACALFFASCNNCCCSILPDTRRCLLPATSEAGGGGGGEEGGEGEEGDEERIEVGDVEEKEEEGCA